MCIQAMSKSSQIFFTSQVLGILSFIPAGIIVMESSLLGFLIQHSIDFSTAAVLIVILRFFTTWIPTMIGAATLKFSFSKNPNEFNDNL